MKKIGDVVDNAVVKKTVYNKLKTKVNKLDKKLPKATTLIYISQYNTDKRDLEKKKLEMLIKKIPDVSSLVTTTVLHTKLKKLRTKYLTLVV